jgi:hypothetical protein
VEQAVCGAGCATAVSDLVIRQDSVILLKDLTPGQAGTICPLNMINPTSEVNSDC